MSTIEEEHFLVLASIIYIDPRTSLWQLIKFREVYRIFCVLGLLYVQYGKVAGGYTVRVTKWSLTSAWSGRLVFKGKRMYLKWW